jgi:hypothetical protein
VYLSEILEFFKLLGYDHVNIIDKGCRSEKVTGDVRRRNSLTEKEVYKQAQEILNFGGSYTK